MESGFKTEYVISVKWPSVATASSAFIVFFFYRFELPVLATRYAGNYVRADNVVGESSPEANDTCC